MKTPWMPPLVASFMALAAPAVVAQGPDPSAQVEQLFRDKCIDCHGADVARPKGGFAGVERVDELLKNSKYVKRFDPSNSLLYRYLSGAQTPQMPKGDEPLSDGELALVRTWIGEKPSGSGTAGGKVGDGGGGSLRLMDDEEIIRTIHHDLSSLPQDDRSHYRYISYANLWNERRPDGASVLEQMAFEREIGALIEQSRHGFVKMLNSLSWSPRMVLPKRVDEAGLVERIDLRELRCADRVTPWSGAQWDMLCAKYPYGRSLGIDQEAAIEKWLGTQLPFVRADWFVYAASRPPLYHDLLGLPGADGRPGADRALELMLGVDVPTNIIEGKRIARAGIRNKQSGVSQHNRLIERHDLADGAYYWKSYDFENSVDKRNVVLRPFGPASLPGLPEDQREVAFDHDGGEIIFSLPNGLQGYLLVTEDGTRIDDGPSKIVFDRDDSADVKGQITNGVSCIACHAAGINLKLDEIREGALNVVSRGLKDELQALYPDGREMNQLQEADKERFMAAVAGLGITSECDQTQCEVVRGVSLRFAENLTFERAAAEFGLAPAEFGDALGGRLKGLRQQLKAGAVSREEFINRFKEIIEDNPDLGELSRCGAALAPPSTGGLQGRIPSGVKVPDWATLIEARPDPAVVRDATLRAAITATGLAWRVKDTGTQIEMLLIPPGSFQMGCSESDQSGCHSDESPRHMVTLTNAFYLGRYEVTQAQWQARMGSNPSFFKSASAQVPAERVPNRPVEQVSWNQIAGSGGFMAQTGMRLPTEAEWEYAYRAGTTMAFHGVAGYLNGTNDTLVGSIAWYTSNSNGETRPVGGKAANGFGVHDMAGNVFEWVSDWYSISYYKSSPSRNPPGPASGISRVFRGGSWSNITNNLRASYRGGSAPGATFNVVGCRAARSP